ncbi:16S rRNA (guanine(527)-N(7))-methyltransferase RsmG [Sphingobium aquiterrae]|uniref:16S rRNA (guanine(527)-N(7))-methyltransferase RsmG n=1 Tax=Sphingobium aquiterrae TaxID=2038656 RepID=UPI00301B2CE0
MTEDEARAWLADRLSVPRGTLERLEAYIALLFDEMSRQNLIAESTREHVWARHIVDSAQLIPMAGKATAGGWIDLGSGAGLPGIVVAILTDWPVLMVESRRKRTEFLAHVIETLGLDNARLWEGRAETLQIDEPAAVISARAFAPMPRLLSGSAHLANDSTLWLLPKGRNWKNELESIGPTWQGMFHVEQSVTDAESAIVVAKQVRKRRGRT